MVEEYQNQAYAASDWSMVDINLGIVLVMLKSNMLKEEAWESGPQLVLIENMC